MDNRIRFTLHLIDDNYSSPVPPAIDHTANCEIPLSDLKNATEILEKVCKTDRFKVICSETIGFEISSPIDAITGYNQTLSNLSFEKKKNRINKDRNYVGYKNGLKLNDDIVSLNVWTVDDIINRTDKLVNYFTNEFTL